MHAQRIELLYAGRERQQLLALPCQFCCCAPSPACSQPCLLPTLLPGFPLPDPPSDWVTAVDEIKQAVEFLRSEGAPKVGRQCAGGVCALTCSCECTC